MVEANVKPKKEEQRRADQVGGLIIDETVDIDVSWGSLTLRGTALTGRKQRYKFYHAEGVTDSV